GRETEIYELLDRVQSAGSRRARSFVTVVGPSGSGKSSLIHAGVIPRLAPQTRRWLVVPPMIPESRPTRHLSRSLCALLPGVPAVVLEDELRDDHVALVRRVEDIRLAHGARQANVLVVVDQAEELLTLTDESERARFLDQLRHLLQQDGRARIVVALR